MSCCGQKRERLRHLSQAAPSFNKSLAARLQPAPARAEPIEAAVRMRYLAHAPVIVHGAITGKQYRFSGSEPVQEVDLRDVQALLPDRFFRRES